MISQSWRRLPVTGRCYSNKPRSIAPVVEINSTVHGSAVKLSRSNYGNVTEVYRTTGHLIAKLDPLDMEKTRLGLPDRLPEVSSSPLSLAELDKIYCDTIGFEVAHVEDPIEREWLYSHIEAPQIPQSPENRKRIAAVLLESEGFDQFMAKRFGQVKRYGLNGGEAMMVAVDTVLRMAGDNHVVVGMPHRGRLNLMVGLLGYPAEAIFHKLTGASELPAEWTGSADVLSHLSHTAGKVSILPNPSHLEAINPVQQGVVFALQKYHSNPALALQIHGDAAFSGQGIVQETLQMCQLDGFAVGGTLHLIVNNQLGYTATATMGRSARYASAPAKIISAPIFHVNSDSPEDVVRVMELAMRYKERFRKDVVVDLLCYRRMGHNELDEPSFTQPLMYRAIQAKKSLPDLYIDTLLKEGIITAEEVDGIKKKTYNSLDNAVKLAKDYVPVNVHNRLQKYHIEARLAMIREGKVDWATAEAMAIGSLLKEGTGVRLVGQDVQRGTFSHRHFLFHDQQTGATVTPLTGNLAVVNSHLSEEAVLGFEYGLSVTAPNVLSIWEAQFGDFFNGAQVILDTFLATGQTKWGLQSGLVLLLPHGYDGTGPEHSSCRMERFLQTSNAPHDATQKFDPNWHVVHPTTPANYFHLLRRQMQRLYRKPLVVVAPKTLLRLAAATSGLADLATGTFQPLIDGSQGAASTLVLCSGKFYYEIERERISRNVADMNVVRIEELCPLPSAEIQQVLHRNPMARVIWCQEEHRNMGPYDYIAPRLQSLMERKLEYVGRDVAAAPAAGYSQLHKSELASIWVSLFSSL